MREIKFRGKRIDNGEWVYGDLLQEGDLSFIVGSLKEFMDTPVNECLVKPDTIGQYTGLKDKINSTCIYEGDILSLDGNIIGNKYENKDLLKSKTNLLIEGICTKKWYSTYKEAIKRGCYDAE